MEIVSTTRFMARFEALTVNLDYFFLDRLALVRYSDDNDGNDNDEYDNDGNDNDDNDDDNIPDRSVSRVTAVTV